MMLHLCGTITAAGNTIECTDLGFSLADISDPVIKHLRNRFEGPPFPNILFVYCSVDCSIRVF